MSDSAEAKPQPRRGLWWVLDGAWLLALIAYILAGVPLVPFHADESTIIWMSKDYASLFQEGDVEQLRYQESPASQTEQHLRLLNPSLTKYLIGLSWDTGGYTAADINEQWLWGAGWDWNVANGHKPADDLLLRSRWPSALMLGGAVLALFFIAQYVAGRPAAYVATLYFVLSPAVLLNGRRAMFEGGLLFFSLLTILAGFWFVRVKGWWRAIVLGVFGGLALSAKHPAAFTLIGVFGGLGILRLASALITAENVTQQVAVSLAKLASASVIALLVFVLLNPVWWGRPLQVASATLDVRTRLMAEQVAAYDSYDDLGDRLTGFFQHVVVGEPQYYEVDGWGDYIGDAIAAYEASPWDGIGMGQTIPGAALLVGGCLLGAVVLWRGLNGVGQERSLLAVWMAVVILAAVALTPLNWQRYYLMAYPVVALLMGFAVQWLWQSVVFGSRTLQRGLHVSAARAGR